MYKIYKVWYQTETENHSVLFATKEAAVAYADSIKYNVHVFFAVAIELESDGYGAFESNSKYVFEYGTFNSKIADWGYVA